MSRPKAKNPRDNFASVRLTANERKDMEESASRLDFNSLSEYVRYLHNLAKTDESICDQTSAPLAEDHPWESVRTHHHSKLGRILHGDARSYLFDEAGENTVDLIITSPPFGLVRKKKAMGTKTHIVTAIGSAPSPKAFGAFSRTAVA